MTRIPVSELGVKRLYFDGRFLRELAEACPVEMDEPVNEDDAWWWLCLKLPAMKAYRKRDLKLTARLWIGRARPPEIIEARDQAEAGKFNHLIPPRR
jgi:hypothetical protein